MTSPFSGHSLLRRHVGALALLVLAATACTTTEPPKSSGDPLVEELDRMIAKAAALPAYTGSADAPAPVMKVMDGKVWASWRGSALDLLERLAPSAGLRVEPLSGPQPRLPIYVQVNAKGATVDEVLKDVGYQLGQRADLVRRPGSIELRYRAH